MFFTTSNKRIECKAVVLSSKNYKETAKSIIILSDNGKLIKFNIYGFNSKKSINKALFQPINRLKIDFDCGKKGQLSLAGVELLKEHINLKKDYDKINSTLILFNTITHLPFLENEGNTIIYKLVSKLLDLYENHHAKSYKIMELYFYYSLTYCLGIKLNFHENCANCGSDIDCRYFDFISNRLLCSHCLKKGNSYLKTNSNLNFLLALFNRSKFENILDIELLSATLYKETIIFLTKYFVNHLDRKIIVCKNFVL